MNSKQTWIIALIIGLLIGGLVSYGIFSTPSDSINGSSSGDKKSLYWVAPMDPNYKRDKPGKSPMGMDLIPVYEEETASSSEGPGTVSIAPHVVNSLGVRTATVERKALVKSIKTVGYIQYDENRLVHIHPRVSGWIEKLYVKAQGEPVKKDQALYQIYSQELLLAQEEYVLALRQQNSRIADAALAKLAALKAPKRFIAQLKQTRKVTPQVTFYAPQSGIVDQLNIREGMYVQPGNTLISIGDLSSVWVEGEVFESDANAIALGDQVVMTLDFHPGQKWQGKVNYIYPTLDPKTRTVRVRVEFKNKELHLKPNMFAQLIIQPQLDEASLVVPREAVIRTGSQDRVVLALGEGSFKSVAVTLGRKTRDYFEVLDGLNEGEKIVVSAQFLIDSESSKSSDFMRMSLQENKPKEIWVAGKINAVYVDERKVNADHDAIEAWNWPAMTMDFKVDASVDIDSLAAGTKLHMQISKLDSGDYAIKGVHIMSSGEHEPSVQSATVNGDVKSINHTAGVATIHRGAIEKWGRGPATIEFRSDPESIIHSLNEGQTIRFTFEIRAGEFVITELHNDNDTNKNNNEHAHH